MQKEPLKQRSKGLIWQQMIRVEQAAEAVQAVEGDTYVKIRSRHFNRRSAKLFLKINANGIDLCRQ